MTQLNELYHRNGLIEGKEKYYYRDKYKTIYKILLFFYGKAFYKHNQEQRDHIRKIGMESKTIVGWRMSDYPRNREEALGDFHPKVIGLDVDKFWDDLE